VRQVNECVPSVDEDAWRRLEPGTAPPAQRLRAVRQLADAGLDAAVLMMPLVPGITTSRGSVGRTMEAIAAAGVRLAGTNVAHLDNGVREHFLAFLEREFPELVDGYRRLYVRKSASATYVSAIKAMVNTLAKKAGGVKSSRG